MLLQQFFEQQYAPYNLRGRSPASYRLYLLTIMQFERTLDRPPLIADLTDANIIKHLHRRHDRAAATRNKELAQLKALWRFAVRRGLHTGWPEVLDEPEPERTPIAWTRYEVHKLLHCANNIDGHLGDIPKRVFLTALLRLGLDTGERIGAMRSARWSWLTGQWINFPAASRKARRRDRLYRLSQATLLALKKQRLYADGDEIFPWPYCHTYLWNVWREFLDFCDLPHGREHGFHKLRKTVASVLDSEGADAQRALDHSDWRTTQRYLDPRFSRKTQPSQILADWLRKPPEKDDGKEGKTG